MSFEEWKHGEAEKNAQSEILAFLLIIMGINLLATGLIITIMTTGQPILFPYPLPQLTNLPVALGLIFTDSGFAVIFAGFALSVHYDKQRSWHLNEIDKSAKRKNWKTNPKTTDQTHQEQKEEKKNMAHPKQRSRGSKPHRA